MDRRPNKQSFADDPDFLASLSALEHGLAGDARARSGQPEQTDTLDSLTDAMWSEVAAHWDALAPAGGSRPSPAALLPSPAPPPALPDTPFASAPDRRFLYHSLEHDRALDVLLSSIVRGETILLLTGADGIGKTTVCQSLVERLDRRTLVSFVASAASDDAFLKRLLVDFGVISSDETARRLASTPHSEMLRALGDFLASLTVIQASALVIVDDADTLSDGAWEALDAVAEMIAGGRPLQILLAGSASLAQRLRSEQTRGLGRREPLRVDLGPLGRDEVEAYIAHRVAVGGNAGQMRFSGPALRDVVSLSAAVPGRVNAICRAVFSRIDRTSPAAIDTAIVAAAARDAGLQHPASASWRERAIVAVLLAMLVLAGAAGAGWFFRAPLSRALQYWSGADRPTSSTPR